MRVDRTYFEDYVVKPALFQAAAAAGQDRARHASLTHAETRNGVRCTVTVTFDVDPTDNWVHPPHTRTEGAADG